MHVKYNRQVAAISVGHFIVVLFGYLTAVTSPREKSQPLADSQSITTIFAARQLRLKTLRLSMPHNKKEWIRREVQALIAAYQTHECLWNWQSPEYRDKTKRKKALATLSQMFNTNETEICRKLHNLRNQFGSELKKSKTKKVYDDEPYVSRWPYFKLLKFIQPSLETGARYSITGGVHSSEITSNVEDNSEDNPVLDTIKVEENCMNNHLEDSLWIHKDEHGDQPHKRSAAALDRVPDEIDTFASFVANEIRSLTSETLRKKLKRKIQRCILEVAEEEDL
ncbi:uncharacterized protein [Tenebrio molitor]|uniref:uncharacterized protein n=1 Tax=Tenebrio molitor TaxID=7067 RepID=UPI001C3BF19E|nr:unnamed protein product [Tenebrio molitor]